jgi:dipeptidyl aminopeptidase/acylaminoacyl peptidase
MNLRVLIAGLVFVGAALAADSGAELFQKAVTQERAAGNLEEAIKLYQRVAKEFASDRPLAAKALVQAARCYEKLGQDKAIKIYEQVARDYGDQREFAATANARLAALRQADRAAEPATMTQRRIEVPGAFGRRVVADGQRALYRDAATGDLVIGDLAGKNKRVVFKLKPGDSFYFAPSRDLSITLIAFRRSRDSEYTRAVIKTDGTDYHEIAGFREPLYFLPTWSWNNRYFLAGAHFPDGTSRLLRISAADGSRQEVLRQDNIISAASFSPDGRFIAYSEGSSGASSASARTFVLPIEGGEPQLVSASANILDWTHDGHYLAVASPRSGVTALQLLPVNDGHPAGGPLFLRYGSVISGQSTPGGALYYASAPQGGFAVPWITDLDEQGRPGDWKRLALGSNKGMLPVPTWSPDSGQIAWTSTDDDTGQTGYVVRLRNLATGKERDLYRGVGMTICAWATRHSNLFCGEVVAGGGSTDILSIALDSGRTEKLGSVPGKAFMFGVPGPDDQALYLGDPDRGVLRWDIGTRQETLLEPGWNSNTFDSPVVSQDGGWLERIAKGNVEVRSLSGGDWKPLLPLRSGSQCGFSPDGKWVFYHDVDASGKDGLYRVATVRGRPERLGDFPVNRLLDGMLIVSPDGRKIIALNVDDNVPTQGWLLENFEPKQQAAK